MWIEIIHNGNIDNDVKMTLSQKLITDKEYLHIYGLDIELKNGISSILVFTTRFAGRFVKQAVRRIRNKIRKE